jgi:hypothetical protein
MTDQTGAAPEPALQGHRVKPDTKEVTEVEIVEAMTAEGEQTGIALFVRDKNGGELITLLLPTMEALRLADAISSGKSLGI